VRSKEPREAVIMSGGKGKGKQTVYEYEVKRSVDGIITI
jgi:hypothetical protein